MFRLILLCFLFPLSLCAQRSAIGVEYTGTWGWTQWTYTFGRNGVFTFSTAGHFGFTSTMGKYRLSGDTVFLNSFPEEKQADSNFLQLNDTLLLDGDSCIIDLSLGYDYCIGKKVNGTYFHHSRQRLKGRKPDE